MRSPSAVTPHDEIMGALTILQKDQMIVIGCVKGLTERFNSFCEEVSERLARVESRMRSLDDFERRLEQLEQLARQ